MLPEKCHVLLKSLLRVLLRKLFRTWINQSDIHLNFPAKFVMTLEYISCPQFVTGLQALGYWQTIASQLYAGLKDYFTFAIKCFANWKSFQVFVYARDSLLLNRSQGELIFVIHDQVEMINRATLWPVLHIYQRQCDSLRVYRSHLNNSLEIKHMENSIAVEYEFSALTFMRR